MAISTQAQKAGVKKPVSTSDIGTDVLTNVLDDYENPTYHFRLYMIAPRAVKSRGLQFGNENDRVVIAESGVSPIDIDNIEITTTGSITKEAGTGIATNITFTIREPFGASLLDKIQRAGLSLGIENFQKFPFYLELSFKGRRSSDISSSSADSPLNTLVWTWPIQLRTMAMNVDTGGSTYAIEAVAYGEHAYTNQASDSEQAFDIEATSVKEYFTELQKKLTAREAEKIKSSKYKFADTYEFWIDDDIFNATIGPDDKGQRDSRGAEFNKNTNKMRFPILPGMSIEMMVREVMSRTSFFKKEMKSTSDVDAAVEVGGGEKAIYSQLWRVIADTEVGEYDFNRQDYQRHFKYLIIPYEMTSNLTPSNLSSNMKSKERYDSHKKRGIIRKRYDYIYSGLNDQVFDFELNFNFNWFVALPIQGGTSTQLVRAEAAAKQTPGQQETANRLNEITNNGGIDNLLNEFPAGALPGFDPIAQLIAMLKDQAASIGSYDASAVQGAMGDIENATTQATDVVGQAAGMGQDGMPFVNEVIPGVSIPQMSPIVGGAQTIYGQLKDAGVVNDRVLEFSPDGPVAQQNLRSIDLQLDDIGTAEHEFKILATMLEVKTKETLGSGQAYATDAGQTLLSALFEQAESPIAGDLLNIELKIKGDPYWLEPNPHTLNTPPTSAFRRLLSNRGVDPEAQGVTSVDLDGTEKDNIPSANTSAQQTLMVFRSFTPQPFDPETGLTPPGHQSVNSLTGLYAIKEVTHSFAAGEFTQTLHGIRDVQVNIRDVDLDSDVSGNISGEYGQTISEQVDGVDDSGLSQTTGDGSALMSVVPNAAGDDTLTVLGSPVSNNASGTVLFDPNDLTPSDLGGIGNFSTAPIGPTSLDDDDGN